MVRRYIGRGPYLDFGCGTGHLLRRLSAHGSASGFEISERAAGLSRQTAPGSPVHTTPEDIPSGVFNGLTAIHVLEHLDDATAVSVLACWRRVLAPGGRALVVTPDPEGGTGDRDPAQINLKPHAQWREFLTGAGFTVLREGSDGLWTVPSGRLPGLRAVPSRTQFLAGRLLLAPGSGASSVFVIERAEE